jgi:transcription factor SPT20
LLAGLTRPGSASAAMMATAVSKPASQPPKMKRPPPSFTQTAVNGIKQSPSASSSPSVTSKRLPGTNQPSTNSVVGPVANGVNNRPINKMRKDSQKPGDPPIRPQRPSTRNSVVEPDRRLTKIPPEPFGGCRLSLPLIWDISLT